MSQLSKILICLSVIVFSILSAKAELRYHCPEDSIKVMEIIEHARKGNTLGEKIVAAAKSMEGIPFAPAADNDSIGTMVLRLDSLNQREFIYIALAAAKTAERSVPTIREFENYLASVSRRKGLDEGFPSQFLYGADWIIDNVYRGNIKEMTEYLDGGSYRTKTLDYVSRHPEQFPAMANPDVADKVKVMEYGYRSHRIPHLKKQSIGNKTVKELLQNGDIIILSPMDSDFDIYDIGIISIENGEPTLIHMPKEEGKVITDPFPVTRRFKIDGQFFYGYRWLRPLE
ncbi:MAG: DUF1460 domain-containing protein [Muribaculaceae bacterium]|nr:DUF1460 domain-containing protein [Muribaculaceae bacterium]